MSGPVLNPESFKVQSKVLNYELSPKFQFPNCDPIIYKNLIKNFEFTGLYIYSLQYYGQILLFVTTLACDSSAVLQCCTPGCRTPLCDTGGSGGGPGWRPCSGCSVSPPCPGSAPAVPPCPLRSPRPGRSSPWPPGASLSTWCNKLCAKTVTTDSPTQVLIIYLLLDFIRECWVQRVRVGYLMRWDDGGRPLLPNLRPPVPLPVPLLYEHLSSEPLLTLEAGGGAPRPVPAHLRHLLLTQTPEARCLARVQLVARVLRISPV